MYKIPWKGSIWDLTVSVICKILNLSQPLWYYTYTSMDTRFFLWAKNTLQRCLSESECCSLKLCSGLHSSDSLLQQSTLNLSKKSFFYQQSCLFWGLEKERIFDIPNTDEKSDPDPRQRDVAINLPYLCVSRIPVRAVRWADRTLRHAICCSPLTNPNSKSGIWHAQLY